MLNRMTRASSPVRGPRVLRGLTLVELMITVAILSVALSLAAPSVSQQVANHRLQRASDGIVTGLSYARAEAARRNSSVSFTLNSDGAGWTVAQVSPASTLQQRANGEAAGISATPGSSSRVVVFTPTGFVDTSGAYLSQVNLASSVAQTDARQVDIFGSGLIRVCDPNLHTVGDPRSC
jgi:type IV fimbrial biogenesis protein FimT